ncbi:MAG: helix-turn-helix domain-containing protein [Pleomorphochaeta sp.]
MTERFDKELFYSDFKNFRTDNKLSQQQFAKKLGLKTHTLVSKIEAGKTYPSDEIFNAFCNISHFNKNKYWKEKEQILPFAFLMGDSNGVTTEDIKKLCKNIATQEYLLVLKKRFYET